MSHGTNVSKLKKELSNVKSWHQKSITIKEDGVIITWDESGSHEISRNCTSIRQAIKELNDYARVL